MGMSINISPKVVPKGSINNTPALLLIMAWRWQDDKSLFEPMVAEVTDAYMRH